MSYYIISLKKKQTYTYWKDFQGCCIKGNKGSSLCSLQLGN